METGVVLQQNQDGLPRIKVLLEFLPVISASERGKVKVDIISDGGYSLRRSHPLGHSVSSNSLDKIESKLTKIIDPRYSRELDST
jgi:hypothetical protein